MSQHAVVRKWKQRTSGGCFESHCTKVNTVISVLVVEDSADDCAAAGRELKDCREVSNVYAMNSAEALRFMDSHTPDIVLTGLSNSETLSLDWVAGVCRKSPFVPVVLMTDPGAEELLVKALRQGAADSVSIKSLSRDLKPTLERILALARKDCRCQGLVGYLTETDSSFLLENDPALFPALVGYLQEGLAQRHLCDETEAVQAGIALGEALLNALYHGNLEVSSDLRNFDDSRFFAMAEARRHESPYRERRIHVQARIAADQAVYVVRDEGRGFDVASLPDPTAPCNLGKACGRGILLIRAFMDDVSYNSTGNQITMIKRRKTTVGEATCEP